MRIVSARVVDQRVISFCDELVGLSKPQQVKFWEKFKEAINGLLFKSEFLIIEACEEFSKTKHGPLIPVCEENYFFKRKLNCYFFQAQNPKQNKKFIKFCLEHEKSKIWLLQKEEVC